jgi:hypothetical protein
MKYTNKRNLPDIIVGILSEDPYSKGSADISVTEMLIPPQMRHLLAKHEDEIEEDLSDRIAALRGRSLHYLVELAAQQNYNTLAEKSIYTECLGWQIKGQFDLVLIGEGELIDVKTCKAYKVKGGKVPSEWVQQTNIYRYMLAKEKGITINKITILAAIWNFDENSADRDPDYPEAPIIKLDVPMWTEEQTLSFMEQRIRLHQEETPQSCSEEDIWAQAPSWAVLKRGRVRAVRVFESQAEAEEHISSVKDLTLEFRPGKAVRCVRWCKVASFCPQWATDPRNTSTEPTMENLFDA